MRKPRLLTEHQRSVLLSLPDPTEERLIARYYTFSENDLEIIQRQHSASSQFALAVQLCFLRYPGGVWQIDEVVPDYLLDYIGQQLQLDSDVLQPYASTSPLRRNHLRSLRQQFNFHLFDDTTRSLLYKWIYPQALSTNKARVLMNNLIEKMRYEQIIIPTISALETFLHPIIQKADTENYRRLTSGLTDMQKQHLDLLLANQGGTKLSYRTWWLQQPPGLATVDNLIGLIDRLHFIRLINLNTLPSYQVNQNRLHQLARRVERLTTTRLKNIRDEELRYAMLVAFVLLETSVLIDHTLDMFLLLYHRIIKQNP
jgi:hypothetical protein